MTIEILQRDSRWQAFYDNISLEEFVKKLPEIRFYADVHQDVKEAFKVIHKLMVHSYYEYLFIDVAVAKALQTFEMALKLRYQEINNLEWNKNLAQLIEHFRKRESFELNNKDFLDHVRNTRNYLSHPAKHHFAGAVWFHWIKTTIDLINDLYDDSTLRKQRKALDVDINQKLKTFLKDGARFQYKTNSLVYAHGHVRVNNFVQPPQVQISLLEIFDNSARVKWPLVISCDISALVLDSESVNLIDHDGNQLTLTNKLSEHDKKSVDEFRKQVAADPQKLMQHNSLLFDSQNALLETWRQERHIRSEHRQT